VLCELNGGERERNSPGGGGMQRISRSGRAGKCFIGDRLGRVCGRGRREGDKRIWIWQERGRFFVIPSHGREGDGGLAEEKGGGGGRWWEERKKCEKGGRGGINSGGTG